jgi:hypothetical protein
MAHSAGRSQKRRIARIRAAQSGRAWLTNAERRAPAPSPRFTLPDIVALDGRNERSAGRAMTAGRIALRRSQRSVKLDGVDATFMIVE